MADQPPLHAVPEPDDDDLSRDDSAFVEDALAGLGHLRPDDAPRGPAPASDQPMPDWVWDRLSLALATEGAAAARAGRRGPTRWAGGLVAAGVAVVAVGIAVTVLRTGGAATVASDTAAGASAESAKLAVPTAQAFAAAEAAPTSAASAGQAADSALSPQPAARMVLDSHTDYQPATLPGQVVNLVKSAGFTTLRDTVSKPVPTPTMPVEDGFTASWDLLRDCITRLTQSQAAQALVVDRGTFAGTEAGVVVAPSTSVGPTPSATLATPVGTFDVWVVDPQCDQVAANLDDFALYAWTS